MPQLYQTNPERNVFPQEFPVYFCNNSAPAHVQEASNDG